MGTSVRMVAICLLWRAWASCVRRSSRSLSGCDLVDVLVDAFDAAELLDEANGSLLADAGDAGNVVGGVALEAFEVGHLLRLEAVVLADGRFVVDHGVALIGTQHEEAHVRPDELDHVAVQADDEGIDALLFGLRGRGCRARRRPRSRERGRWGC